MEIQALPFLLKKGFLAQDKGKRQLTASVSFLFRFKD
jgi:hypothetical protein